MRKHSNLKQQLQQNPDDPRVHLTRRTSECLPYLHALDYEDVGRVMEQPVPVDSMLYFYGGISRETAEWILWDRGCQDGMYLLRESSIDYVLSLCFQKSVLHYRIKRLPCGGVGLCGVPNQRFSGPVELVEGVEGLACKPTIPCNKSLDAMLSPTHWGLSEDEVKSFMLLKAREWGIDEAKLDAGLSQQTSNDFRILLSKTLHEIQPWFHGLLSRTEADERIESSGHKDGKFLVRERDDSSYALCLSHCGRIKHYKIDVLPSGEFGIQDGQRFPSIMAMVSHYTLFSDGLWCTLTEPCSKPGWKPSCSPTHPTRFQSNQDSSNRIISGHGSSDKSSNEGHSPVLTVSNNEKNSNRTSRLLSSLNQKGLLTKLVASISPQVISQDGDHKDHRKSPPNTRAIPHNYNTMPSTCPRITDDFQDSTKQGDMSSSPPQSSRKPYLDSECKKNRIQKTSSFDLLPGFISYLFSGESENERRTRRKAAEANTKRLPELIDRTLPRSSSPRRSTLPPASRTVGQRSAPVPAPRLSLVKRVHQQARPVYANQDSLGMLGRSASLGESNIDKIPEEDVDDPPLIDFDTQVQPFSRSASSPSVVTHPVLRPYGSVPSGDPDEPPPLPPLPNSDVLVLCDLDSQPQTRPRPKLASCVKDKDSVPSPPLVDLSDLKEESEEEDAPYEEIDTDSLLEELKVPYHISTSEHADDMLSDDEGEPEDLGQPPSLSGSEPSSPIRYLHADGSFKQQTFSKEESESAYHTITRFRHGPVSLDPKSISLKQKIGVGNFGEVHRGVFESGPIEVQFAAKMLKPSLVATQKADIIKEAQTMAALDHPHIVRLIGVCEGSSFMLIMELAPLGPLNRFLKLNKDIEIPHVLNLMLQVASAMEYLEARQYVHRDLAGRNVLLVNENFTKVSDFGMTRAIGVGKEYYRAEVAGKWPLKWYAPECIYYFKFSSKSDIWSYGVTLWEAMSYGEKPYQGMIGHDILKMFESNRRLEQPEDCPSEVYEIMWKCWNYRPEDRPTFTEVCNMMKDVMSNLQ